MPNQTVSYDNGVITLTKRDGSQQLMAFDGDSDELIASPSFTSVRAITFAELAFSASGSMTWTVESGDFKDCVYMEAGKLSMLWLRLVATSIGGTPSTQLNIDLPSFVPLAYSSAGLDQLLASGAGNLDGATTTDYCAVSIEKGTRRINIRQRGGGNWSASTNNQHVSIFLAWPTQAVIPA